MHCPFPADSLNIDALAVLSIFRGMRRSQIQCETRVCGLLFYLAPSTLEVHGDGHGLGLDAISIGMHVRSIFFDRSTHKGIGGEGHEQGPLV